MKVNINKISRAVFDATRPNVASFSGGRTSAFMVNKLAILAHHHDVIIHNVFMDTGAEEPETYEFIKKIINIWKEKVTRLRVVTNPEFRKASGFKIISQDDLKQDLGPWREMLDKFGTPYFGGARCTDRMKNVPYRKYCQSLFGRKKYNTWLGIRFDEPNRLWGEKAYAALHELGYNGVSAAMMFNEAIRICRNDAKAAKKYLEEKAGITGYMVRNNRNKPIELIDLMINGLILKVENNIYYLSEISEYGKEDVIKWWAVQEFDLGIDEHLGNCVFCIKKANTKIALAAKDRPEMADQFWQLLTDPQTKIEDNRKGRHLEMYRSHQTLKEIIAIFSDVPRDELAGRMRSMRDKNSDGCGASCEVLGECSL